MKISELITELQELDPSYEVIMSRDSEGNGYSPLADFETASYLADTTWRGDIGFAELTPELKMLGYSEEDVIVGGVPAVVLYPTN